MIHVRKSHKVDSVHLNVALRKQRRDKQNHPSGLSFMPHSEEEMCGQHQAQRKHYFTNFVK